MILRALSAICFLPPASTSPPPCLFEAQSMGGTSSRHQEDPNASKASLSRSASVPASSSSSRSKKMPWRSRMPSMLHSRKKESSQNVVPEDFDCEHYTKFGNADVLTVNVERFTKPELSSCRLSALPNHLDAECQSLPDASRASGDGRNVCVQASVLQSCSVCDGNDMFPTELSIGLRLLLNPGTPSSKIFVSPTRDVSLKASLLPAENCSLKTSDDSNLEAPPRKVSVSMDSDRENAHATDSMAKISETDPGISLFDPCILATFEKAVENSYVDCWQGSEVSTSKNTLSSIEPFSDGDGCQCPQENGVQLQAPIWHNLQLEKKAALCDSNSALSEVLALALDKAEWSREDCLGLFKKMCPPGCEGKIVLYFTSLRAIRKTFEDGFMMRLVLKGLRVQVDERDVWMHSKFRQELTGVMGMAVTVPRLFIMGRYIGGPDEVKVLHEEGILVRLVEGLPKCYKEICSVCADVRFILCTECRGSCKTITRNNVVVRCLKCNENGLMMCSLCGG